MRNAEILERTEAAQGTGCLSGMLLRHTRGEGIAWAICSWWLGEVFELYKSLNYFMAYFSTEMKILWDQIVLDKHVRLLRTASGFIAL